MFPVNSPESGQPESRPTMGGDASTPLAAEKLLCRKSGAPSKAEFGGVAS